MTFSEFLRILHSYIGIDYTNQDYISFIVMLIMREPVSKAEVQEDNLNNYYPYNSQESEKDFQGRIYNGKPMPKNKARMIKKYYDSSAFVQVLDELDTNARKNMSVELFAHGITCSPTSLPHICEEIIKLLIDAAAIGINEVDTSLVGEGKEKTLQVYDDSDLKKLYGVHLLAETKQHCPNDNCLNALYYDVDGKSAFNYSIVQINPKFPRNTVDNLIALCPECAKKYMFNLTGAKVQRMEDIKLRITMLSEAFDKMNEEKTVEGVERVLQNISTIPIAKVMELNYDPVEVVRKMDGNNSSLFIKISTFVNKYYIDVENIFKQLEKEGGLDYERFCLQMKYQYKVLAQQGLSQGEIFEHLVVWLSEITNEEKGPCEVVVSFFVQKCEVFDVIS